MKRCIFTLTVIFLFIFTFITTVPALQWKNDPDPSSLFSLVDMSNVDDHQKMFMQIAEDHNDNRAAGSEGYQASSDYVVSRLQASGLDVNIQEFVFPFYQELSEPVFQSIDPEDAPYTPNDQKGFYAMTYSGSGEVLEGAVAAVDVVMPPAAEANTSNSGCEAEDFTNFPAGAVALIQRGTCAFYDKALNAQNAGASAVIVYNEGQDGRRNAVSATLQFPEFTIPVISTTFEIGQTLYELSRTRQVLVKIVTNTISDQRTTHNIIAATKDGDPGSTLVVGAHLDSVTTGPGINDNASGSSIVLEAATKMGSLNKPPANKVVFAFWGAEELGLLGSEYYVSQFSEEDKSNIALYLNFDMVASPNYVRFVFDGDGSDTSTAGPAGSGFIEKVFVDYFADNGMATEPTELAGNSDYAPFAEAGIPIGGMATGAGDLKTEEQAAVYGGMAGRPYDENYHTLADNLGNLNTVVEKQILEAMAYAIDYFANESFPKPDPSLLKKAAVNDFMFDYRGSLAVR
jgi:Zn-dependent M28 family amino/carboxypeptidase